MIAYLTTKKEFQVTQQFSCMSWFLLGSIPSFSQGKKVGIYGKIAVIILKILYEISCICYI